MSNTDSSRNYEINRNVEITRGPLIIVIINVSFYMIIVVHGQIKLMYPLFEILVDEDPSNGSKRREDERSDKGYKGW